MSLANGLWSFIIGCVASRDNTQTATREYSCYMVVSCRLGSDIFLASLYASLSALASI
jgi:hypothetical protein